MDVSTLILFGIGEALDFQPGSGTNITFYKVVNTIILYKKKSSHPPLMVFQMRSPHASAK